jgi:hypothetical protein
MAFMRKLILFSIFFLVKNMLCAQSMVQVKGVVFDADSNALLDSVTIIVKNTSRIMQNKTDGSFSVFVKPSDTLIFGIYGYKVKYLCFKDSSASKDYSNVKVQMLHLSEEMNEVTIKESRTQREIRRDMRDLGMEHAAALQKAMVTSPVSAIYDRYSKKALTHQLLIEYEYELAKCNLIYELLDIYNRQGIINIPPDQYKAFVTSLNLGWDYLGSAGDYDLAVFIKQKAIEWVN